MIKLGAHKDWTKSSRCGNGATCVEVRSTQPTAVEVTDSKIDNRPSFTVGSAAFSAFVAGVRS